MKKALTLFLLLLVTVCIAFMFVGCGGNKDTEETPGVETNYTVTFDSDGGSTVEAQKVESGGKANEPQDPTKMTSTAEYRFDGWFYGDKKWDFTVDTVLSNIILVAKWTAVNMYTPEFLPSN